MTRCKGCGQNFRKGRRRAVLQEDGSVVVALVCGTCAGRCFSVVLPIGAMAQLCAVCKKSPARVCSECSRRSRLELLAPILATLRGMAVTARLQEDEALTKAYEHAYTALAAEAERGP